MWGAPRFCISPESPPDLSCLLLSFQLPGSLFLSLPPSSAVVVFTPLTPPPISPQGDLQAAPRILLHVFAATTLGMKSGSWECLTGPGSPRELPWQIGGGLNWGLLDPRLRLFAAVPPLAFVWGGHPSALNCPAWQHHCGRLATPTEGICQSTTCCFSFGFFFGGGWILLQALGLLILSAHSPRLLIEVSTGEPWRE